MTDIFYPKKFLGDVIDRLRERGNDEIADKLQFGEEGRDEFDGHRCRLCGKCAGGDASHRCWDGAWQRENFKLHPCPVCGKPYSICDPKIFHIDPYVCRECRAYSKIVAEDQAMLFSEESQLKSIAVDRLAEETLKLYEAEAGELVRRFCWSREVVADDAKKIVVFRMLKRCLVQNFDSLCYVLTLCDREPSFKSVCLKILVEDFPEVSLDVGTRDFLECY